MSVDDGTCDYCGGRLQDWYEVTAILAAYSAEFPLQLRFAGPAGDPKPAHYCAC